MHKAKFLDRLSERGDCCNCILIIRLKTNIELIGIDSHTKLPTYEFAYKAAPTIRYRGVMAQDVEKVYPQAVVEGTDGYKRVRYDMLGMSMERVRS
jgi:hypothetical protein